MAREKGTEPAPEGKVWVCLVCGKLSHTKHGFYENGKSAAITSGWETSCMTRAILIDENKLVFGEGDRVIEVL